METLVITQQPASPPSLVCSVSGARDWNSGLSECCLDWKSFLFTFCCVGCAVSNITKRTGECCMTSCVPGGLMAMRARLRTLGGIQGSICNDWVAITCCPLFAICQMQRELDHMGL